MDQELFQRMQEAAVRFRSGESDFEEIMTPAGPAHLVRDRNDPRGFRLDFVGDGARHVVPVQEYPAASSRPPGYPAPLPFLAGCRAVVNTLDQSVSWPAPPDLEAAVAHLLQESLDDGWSRVHRLPTAGSQEPSDVRCVLTKDGAERTVLVDTAGVEPRIVLQEKGATRPA